MKKTDIFNTFNYIGVLVVAIIISGYWLVDDLTINKYILGYLVFIVLLAMYINYQLNNPLEMGDDYNEDDDE
jgi:amino acid permease